MDNLDNCFTSILFLLNDLRFFGLFTKLFSNYFYIRLETGRESTFCV